MWTYHHGMSVKLEDNSVSWFSPSTCARVPGSNSGCQAAWQTLSPAKPSHWPQVCCIFKMKLTRAIDMSQVDKGACCQGWWPESPPEPTWWEERTNSYKLSSTHMLWHAHIFYYNKINKILKLIKISRCEIGLSVFLGAREMAQQLRGSRFGSPTHVAAHRNL